MKPLFGIDVTQNKKNETVNGFEFLTEKPSQALTNAFEESSEQVSATYDKSGLPLPLEIIKYVTGIASAVVFAGVIRNLSDELTLSQAYSNAKWLFWIAGISFAVFITLVIMSAVRRKSVFESDEGQQPFAKIDRVTQNIFAELSVPAEADDVDVLTFTYKQKDGEIKAYTRGISPTAYMTAEVKMYIENDCLQIVSLEGKFSVPVSSLKTIRRINKKIGAFGWNKETEPNKGEYKQYKIQSDNFPLIYFKPYYILDFDYNGESWGLYFPCYELKAVQRITGLEVTE